MCSLKILISVLSIIQWSEGNVIDICDDYKNSIYAFVGRSNFMSTKRTDLNFSRCSLQVVTCPACVIVIKIWLFEMAKKCEKDNNIVPENDESECNCDRIEITEPLHKVYSRNTFCTEYENDVNGGGDGSLLNLTRPTFVYHSQSRGVKIMFEYSQKYEQPFTIEFTAKYNIHNIDVIADSSNPSSLRGSISTPFFPIHYPSDLRTQYNIKCKPKVPSQCRIKLVFTDHQLASTSILEFLEGKKRRLGVATGRQFRPPIVISNGPSLSVNFYANKASSFGFKADYVVILDNGITSLMKPKTTCGGYIKDIGGAITMINMVAEGDFETFDCIWIIKPTNERNALKTHVFVKVLEFYKMGHDVELEIHKGPTSQHKLLQRLNATQHIPASSAGYEAPLGTGFYLSMKGTFNASSRLVISYAAFSFSHSHELGIVDSSEQAVHGCYQSTDFLCYNHRCIENHLHCDGLDHCGDYSDEAGCNYGGENSDNWRLYKQNYYFPNVETYSSVPTGFIVAFCITFITFLLCSLVCSVVYKMKQQSDLNNRLRSIRRVMMEQRIQEGYADESGGLVEEPPPEYDFPPSYHDAVVHSTMKKVIHDSKKLENTSTELTSGTGCSTAACNSGLYNLVKSREITLNYRSSSEDDSLCGEAISNSNQVTYSVSVLERNPLLKPDDKFGLDVSKSSQQPLITQGSSRSANNSFDDLSNLASFDGILLSKNSEALYKFTKLNKTQSPTYTFK